MTLIPPTPIAAAQTATRSTRRLAWTILIGITSLFAAIGLIAMVGPAVGQLAQVQPQQQATVAQAAADIEVRRGEPAQVTLSPGSCSRWINISSAGRYDTFPSGPVKVHFEGGDVFDDGPNLNPDFGSRSRARFYVCAAQPTSVSVVAR